jgi:hypothetical protein
VLLAEPVRWEVEYRCFVLERTLTTISVYLRDGKLAQTTSGTWEAEPAEIEQAQAFCQTLLADATVMLPPACVMDVGRIAGRGWAVIEANPAFASGIYGCDPTAVLSVVNRATRPMNAITTQDAFWVKSYEIEE